MGPTGDIEARLLAHEAAHYSPAQVLARCASINPERCFDTTTTSAGSVVGKFRPGALADLIMVEQPFVCFDDMGRELRWFDGRIWRTGGEGRLRELALAALDKDADVAKYIDKVTTHGFTELENQVKVKCQVWHDEWLTQDLDLVPLANGIIDLRTSELAPYDHAKHHFLAVVPVDWDPYAACPAFDRFVAETVAPNRADIVPEMFGYCLWRDYTYKKAIMLTAPGDNGKSVLLDVLEAFLGNENIANQPLSLLSESRFAAAALKDKLANIGADLPDRAVKETGMFKMLTGHDTLSYERKGKDPGSFRNHAKLIFSANKIPDAHDTTEAYFSRWIIVEFPWTFVKNPNPKEPTQKKARDRKELTDELTTRAELSGILNKAVTALARMRAQNGFSYDMDAAELKQEYTRRSNSLKAFVNEECDIAPSRTILVEDFYREYIRYCERQGMAPKEVGLVGREMRQFAEVSRHMKRVSGERKYEYHGITAKSFIPTDEAIDEGIIQQTDVERFAEPALATSTTPMKPTYMPQVERAISEPMTTSPSSDNGGEQVLKAEAQGILDSLGGIWDADTVEACLNYILHRMSAGDACGAFLVRSEVGGRFPDKRETVASLVDARYSDLEKCAKALKGLGKQGVWP